MRIRHSSTAVWSVAGVLQCALAGVLLCVTAMPVVASDLRAALAEKDLEKRSKLALDNALVALKAARFSYLDGDLEKTQSGVNEVAQSVELAYRSLEDTHKNPRKSPKWFKNAELATRDILRRLDTFDHDMTFDDRPMLKPIKDRVQKVHDDLLLGLMEGKPK
jgi:hypothetical protein